MSMPGSLGLVDDGPWTACAICGAIMRPDPDALDDDDEYPVWHDQVCADCARLEAEGDETNEGE